MRVNFLDSKYVLLKYIMYGSAKAQRMNVFKCVEISLYSSPQEAHV